VVSDRRKVRLTVSSFHITQSRATRDAVILPTAAMASSPTGAVILTAPPASASFRAITVHRKIQKRSPKFTAF
jgi:hypothetical protein